MGSIESLFELNLTPDLKPTYGPRHSRSRRRFGGSRGLFHKSRLARVSTEEKTLL